LGRFFFLFFSIPPFRLRHGRAIFSFPPPPSSPPRCYLPVPSLPLHPLPFYPTLFLSPPPAFAAFHTGKSKRGGTKYIILDVFQNGQDSCRRRSGGVKDIWWRRWHTPKRHVRQVRRAASDRRLPCIHKKTRRPSRCLEKLWAENTVGNGERRRKL